MKRLIHIMLCTALVFCLLLSGLPVYAASAQIKLPTFPVTLNGRQIENATLQYPLIVYKDITYFPMTYYDCRFLSLESNYTPESGLSINKTGISGDYNGYKISGKNLTSGTAQTATFSIRVNGKAIDNSKEQYPLLVYKDITYFPLTWRFAVDEFGWEYSFDNAHGLVINSVSRGSGSATGGSFAPAPSSSEGEIITVGPSEQILTMAGWAGEYNDNDVMTKTEFVLYFSGWPLSFSTSDLSNMKLTKDGKETKFSFSGNVEQRPIRGTGVPQYGFYIELTKPLTEPGVYVMTGIYKGTTFTTDEWLVE